MKKLILLVILLFAGQVQAGDTLEYRGHFIPNSDRSGVTPPAPYTRNDTMDRQTPMLIERDTPELRARLIKEWAASGEICRVLEHRWIVFWYDKVPNGSDIYAERTCPVCNRHEKKYVTTKEEWR